MVLLSWQIGNDVLTRQEREGWGAKVIDRLFSDLVHEFPDMQRPGTIFNVQQVAAQIPWFHHCVILDKVTDRPDRE